MERIKAFSERRNKIVHGLWSIADDDDGVVRMFLGPSFETLDYATRYPSDGPKAKSAQDRNIFTAMRIDEIVREGRALQVDLHKFILAPYPDLLQMPPQTDKP